MSLKGRLQQLGIPTNRRGVRVPLAASDAAGGVFAWQNPSHLAVIVTGVWLHVLTKSTAACTLDIGVSANATTLSDTLIDGVDVGTAAGIFDLATNKGSSGSTRRLVDKQGGADDHITGSKASGAAAGLVGFVYIEYIETSGLG
jgi:hypothetical protein